MGAGAAKRLSRRALGRGGQHRAGLGADAAVRRRSSAASPTALTTLFGDGALGADRRVAAGDRAGRRARSAAALARARDHARRRGGRRWMLATIDVGQDRRAALGRAAGRRSPSAIAFSLIVGSARRAPARRGAAAPARRRWPTAPLAASLALRRGLPRRRRRQVVAVACDRRVGQQAADGARRTRSCAARARARRRRSRTADVGRHDAVGADHAALADRHAAGDHDVGAAPDVVADARRPLGREALPRARACRGSSKRWLPSVTKQPLANMQCSPISTSSTAATITPDVQERAAADADPRRRRGR